MKRDAIFWACGLIVAGVLLLLSNMNLLPFPVWNVIGPVALIAVGAWVVYGAAFGWRAAGARPLAVPMEPSQSAEVAISHGAGELDVSGGAGLGELVAGSFGGGVAWSSAMDGACQRVKLKTPWTGFAPWEWLARGARRWSVSLSSGVPLALKIEAGASRSRIDLSGLKLTGLDLALGASSAEVRLPAGLGHTRVKIEAGAASVHLRIPPEAAARIHWEGGLATLDIDHRRFARSHRTYETAGYAQAADRLEIDIEAGVGTVTVQ